MSNLYRQARYPRKDGFVRLNSTGEISSQTTGYIVTAGGIPASRVVILELNANGLAVGETRSNESGEWFFQSVPPGTYSIRVRNNTPEFNGAVLDWVKP